MRASFFAATAAILIERIRYRHSPDEIFRAKTQADSPTMGTAAVSGCRSLSLLSWLALRALHNCIRVHSVKHKVGCLHP